jgi:hypothetical protein
LPAEPTVAGANDLFLTGLPEDEMRAPSRPMSSLSVLPTAPDVDVLCQNAHDRRSSTPCVTGEYRQQQL